MTGSHHQGVPIPLSLADSERTLILRRQPGTRDARRSTEWADSKNASKGRSAYFVDSDTSGASAAGDKGVQYHGQPHLWRPQQQQHRQLAAPISSVALVETINDRIPAVPSVILGGIRCGRDLVQQYEHNESGTHSTRAATRRVPNSHSENAHAGSLRKRPGPVFYGSVRFPSSSVALWSSRATGSPLMLTPELAAPVLVLHQPAVDLIASTLSSAGGRGSRRWHGVLGPAVDALEGCATSDPRAASVLSGVALEVTGVSGDGSARDASINGGNFPSARSSGKWLGSCQAGGVVMDGELMIEDSHDGNTGGGRGGLALTANEAYYRERLDECSKAVSDAKSANPAIFTQLRLHCSFKYAAKNIGVGGHQRHSPRHGRNESSRRGQPEHARSEKADTVRQVTVCLRGEMTVPAVGVQLTPISPLALLHTAFYQSLLTRGAEDRLQSGFLTLNEGRRAVLLSDTDPLTLRAPIVGVWVSGRASNGGNKRRLDGGVQRQPSASRYLPPLGHAHLYPACLRFLFGFRGNHCGGGFDGAGRPAKSKRNSRDVASPESFLVLHVQGGVDGGPAVFFQASAVHAGKTGSSGGRSGLDISSLGFEQLDFTTDIDAAVSSQGVGKDGGGMGVGTSGSRDQGRRDQQSRPVVIGKMRTVSNETFATPFARALEERRRSFSDSKQGKREQGDHDVPSFNPPQPPAATHSTPLRSITAPALSTPSSSRLLTPTSQPTTRQTMVSQTTGSQGAGWHSRQRIEDPRAGEETADPLPRMPPEERAHDVVSRGPPRGPAVGARAESSRGPFVDASEDLGHRTARPGMTTRTDPLDLSPRPEQTRVASHSTRENDSPVQGHAIGLDGSATSHQAKGVSTERPTSSIPDDEHEAASPIPQESGSGDHGFIAEELHANERQGVSDSSLRTPESISSSGPLPLPFPSPSPSLPPQPSRTGHQHSHKPAILMSSFDLTALHPAAREVFIVQQQQLSALEEQLRLLQVTMRSQQQQQQQQQERHPPRLLVNHKPSHPSSVVEQVHLQHTTAAAEPSKQNSIRTLPRKEPIREVLKDVTATSQSTGSTTPNTQVEASTNTSFSWGTLPPSPLTPPPVLFTSSSGRTAVASENSSDGRIINSKPIDTAKLSERHVSTPNPLSKNAGGRRRENVKENPREERAEASPSPSHGQGTAPAAVSPDDGDARVAISSARWATETSRVGASAAQRRVGGDAESGVEGGDGDVVSDEVYSSGTETDEDARQKFPLGPLRLPPVQKDVHGLSPRPRHAQVCASRCSARLTNSRPPTSKSDMGDVVLVDCRSSWQRCQCCRRQAGHLPLPTAKSNDGTVVHDGCSRRKTKKSEKSAQSATRNSSRNDLTSAGDVDDHSDDGASGTSQEEEEEVRAIAATTDDKDTIRSRSWSHRDRGYHKIALSGSGGSGGGDGDGGDARDVGNRFDGGGSDGVQDAGASRQIRPLQPTVATRDRRGATAPMVVPVPIMDLVIVPRIEYGHLTDEELGSDFDEGETIGRIESKYLQGGGFSRRSFATTR